MAGFSDAERDRIRRDLLEAGHAFFARFGLEKTTVTELADEADISAGSFYSFFDSKERLYLAVLEEKAGSVYGDALENLQDHDDPEAAVVAFLQSFFTYAEEEPLMRQVLEGEYRDRLVDATTEAERREAKSEKVALLAPFIEDWQEAGLVRDGDPATLALAIESVGFLTLHEDEFDSREEYEAVRDAQIELVAAGLTKIEESR